MRVYSVEYVIASDSKIHRIHVHAPSVKDVLDKLADRFGNELQEFETGRRSIGSTCDQLFARRNRAR